MSGIVISGIQQVGIGVSNLAEAWRWYRKHFGVGTRVFEDRAKAALMKNYTGGHIRNRQAAMAVNIQGGGGFEATADQLPVNLGQLSLTVEVTVTYRIR